MITKLEWQIIDGLKKLLKTNVGGKKEKVFSHFIKGLGKRVSLNLLAQVQNDSTLLENNMKSKYQESLKRWPINSIPKYSILYNLFKSSLSYLPTINIPSKNIQYTFYLLVLWSWANYLNFMSLSLLLCKNGNYYYLPVSTVMKKQIK